MWSITLSSSYVLRIFITSSTDRLVECMCHKIVDPPSWKVSVPTSKQNQFCGFIISPHLSFSWSCVFFLCLWFPILSLSYPYSCCWNSSCCEIPWNLRSQIIWLGCAVGTCRIYAVMHRHKLLMIVWISTTKQIKTTVFPGCSFWWWLLHIFRFPTFLFWSWENPSNAWIIGGWCPTYSSYNLSISGMFPNPQLQLYSYIVYSITIYYEWYIIQSLTIVYIYNQSPDTNHLPTGMDPPSFRGSCGESTRKPYVSPRRLRLATERAEPELGEWGSLF